MSLKLRGATSRGSSPSSLSSFAVVVISAFVPAFIAVTYYYENRRLREKERRLIEELENKGEEMLRLQSRSVHAIVEDLDMSSMDDAELQSLKVLLADKASEVTVEITKRTLLRNEKNQSVCVVCIEKEKTHTFLPCGHRCACADCAREVLSRTRKCPLCRSPSTNAVQVYV